jgi:Uma2 family endonuclease
MSTHSDAQNKYVTIEEYLQLEEYSEVKHEYAGGSIVEMPGAKYNHHLVGSNTLAILSNVLALPQPTCKVLMDGMKYFIPAFDSILYPDLIVICGTPVFYKDREDVLMNPKVIIEVLSDSTRHYDRGQKFEMYSSIGSMEEYVLIEPDQPLVEVFFAINKEENTWKISRYRNLEEHVYLHSLDVNLLMKDIYKRIDFSSSPT